MSVTSADIDGAPPLPRSRDGRIVLGHGGGGQLTDELIAHVVLPRLGNTVLNALGDSGVMDAMGVTGVATGGRLAMTIDSYVVSPWSFPGGDIGRLAVCGTVNDLAVSGARPLGLALSLILSEGMAVSDLERILDSAAATADEAGVSVVTGDTKVVGRGQADEVYITTAGVGVVGSGVRLGEAHVKAGDVVLINGPVGEHGLAVMLAREMPEVRSVLRSDAAPLNGMIDAVLSCAGDSVSFMRDATRSGLAGVGVDLAARSGRHITLDGGRIAVKPAALHAAEMLGIDPLEAANEGRVVMVVRPGAVEAVLEVMRRWDVGVEAGVIGEVGEACDGICELRTAIGGRRIVQKPYGEQLPRIC